MKELMDIKRWGQSKWRMPLIVAVLAVVIIGSIWLNVAPFRSGFWDNGWIGWEYFSFQHFVCCNDRCPGDCAGWFDVCGSPKSCIAVKVRSAKAYSRVRIEVAETPFFSRSVSEFVVARPRTEYTIYPDIIWNYEALKNNNQAEPISVAVTVEMNRKELGQRVPILFRCAVSMSVYWGMLREVRDFMIPEYSLLLMSMKKILW